MGTVFLSMVYHPPVGALLLGEVFRPMFPPPPPLLSTPLPSLPPFWTCVCVRLKVIVWVYVYVYMAVCDCVY